MNTRHASGSFSVTMLPQAESGFATTAPPGITLGRVVLDKQYQGDLQASAQGQMLSAMTSTAGSAGYVAIECVSGSLHGRAGSFVLQHSGIMDRGSPQLVISVVPGSASGDLAGLAGSLNIVISEGRHRYEFDYTLP